MTQKHALQFPKQLQQCALYAISNASSSNTLTPTT